MTDGLSEAYEMKKWDVFCENNDLLLENDELKAENARLRELILDAADMMGENEKLRELAEQLRMQLADVTESMGRVEERCAKLRSMVHDMRYCIKRNHRCDNCDFNVGTDCLLFVNINKRMRELGVEVNDA